MKVHFLATQKYHESVLKAPPLGFSPLGQQHMSTICYTLLAAIS